MAMLYVGKWLICENGSYYLCPSQLRSTVTVMIFTIIGDLQRDEQGKKKLNISGEKKRNQNEKEGGKGEM